MKPNPPKRLVTALKRYKPVSLTYKKDTGGRIVFDNKRHIDFGADHVVSILDIILEECPDFAGLSFL